MSTPLITIHTAWGYNSCVLFTIGTSDLSGIYAYQLHTKISTGAWTWECTTQLDSPYNIIEPIEYLKQCNPGETISLSAIVMNQLGETVTTSVSATSLTGTYALPSIPATAIPNFEIHICEDTNIELVWSSWETYVDYEYAIPIDPIRFFMIYRKLASETTYTYVGSALSTDTSFIDTTHPTLGLHDYRLVGIDYYYRRRSLGGRVQVVDNPQPGVLPFIEPYCGMLPIWTAAPAKIHTTSKLYG